jgi:hypothetical protein
VTAPTLLIVGSLDIDVLALNRAAQRQLPSTSALEIVPGATHLFSEPGALEQVTQLASKWFATHLSSRDVEATADPVLDEVQAPAEVAGKVRPINGMLPIA